MKDVMKQIITYSFILSSIVLLFTGCSTTPKVTRIGVEEQIDLSGYWNDTDSRLVASEMINDVLSRGWLEEFLAEKNRKPVIIVGTISNKSHEHINTETFVKDLERELINSGKVKFVASKEQREEIREEKLDQMAHAEETTAKPLRKETGADFMLKGQINTILDEAGNTLVKYYQVELELIDIRSHEKVWIGQKKIKKVVQRPKTRF